ncbi:serine hydrolase domain-containing protein [Egicoccus sp. AB-alg6-2]|uniref:serine hydrolase domain-containing protein n=1 Tax=Egicoccus sp. AB-alg6-2 TaxID=3242692 RepID=UPI00359EF0A6
MTAHHLSCRRPVIAFALTGLLVLQPAAATAAAADTTAIRTGESVGIDRWVEERVGARDLPGVAVAVVRGGQVVHLAGYGVADDTGRPVTPDTPFLLGSASKPFTAAVVGQLVEEGVLSWDEPVWPHLAHLVDRAPDGFETVTVEQLITHTAGLGMYVGVAGEVTLHDGPNALGLRVAELLAHPLAHPPGDTFAYSNAGFTLLAAVVEQVASDRFADQLQDRIFGQLGMSGSFATADDHRAADLATGHRLWFGRWRPAALPYDDAGVAMGYVASTARDLARFMEAHLESHPAIPATAAQIAAGPVEPTGWTTTLDAGYGRGWFVDEFAGTTVVSHTGSLGHFTGHLLLAPEADSLGIAVLSNASAFVAGGPGDPGHDAQYDLGFGLLRILLGEQPQPVNPTPLMTLALPVGGWAIVALLPTCILRSAFRSRHRTGAESGTATRRVRVRQLLPGAFAIIGGAALLTAPLGMVRHFHPDIGWALTSLAWLALALGAVRFALPLLSKMGRSSGN